ncbi:MAG TPA: M50 family metallopeptidase [Sphingomicrobium sp.]|jgi:regulator of sigma E protease|nr:M50 family metallopeptidase [Sphingomicrobium sp.]
MLPQPPLWLILLAFICALGPLVFFHELGHYLVGRIFHIPAETFSIGFGHELVGWTDRQGTRWKVGWLPLGGYVKFVGDMTPAGNPDDLDHIPPELREHAFQLRPVWQRFLVVLAGPAANFLLAIAIFAVFFMALGAPRTNIVGATVPKTAAAAAGLRPGDKILSVAGQDTPNFDDIRSVVLLRPNETVPVRFERGGEARLVLVHLGTDTVVDPFGQRFTRGLLGVYPTTGVLQRLPVYEAIPEATSYTLLITRSMVDGLVQIVTGRRGTEDVGGPIKIAQIAGQQAALGALPFVQLLALFSINLGFINLLPVPMLDGGHLFFYAVEAVRRRPLSARALDWAFRGGLAVILALVVFTTFNDLGSLGLWDRLQRLIG